MAVPLAASERLLTYSGAGKGYCGAGVSVGTGAVLCGEVVLSEESESESEARALNLPERDVVSVPQMRDGVQGSRVQWYSGFEVMQLDVAGVDSSVLCQGLSRDLRCDLHK